MIHHRLKVYKVETGLFALFVWMHKNGSMGLCEMHKGRAESFAFKASLV